MAQSFGVVRSDSRVRAEPGFFLASGLVVAFGAQIFAVESAVLLAVAARLSGLFKI